MRDRLSRLIHWYFCFQWQPPQNKETKPWGKIKIQWAVIKLIVVIMGSLVLKLGQTWGSHLPPQFSEVLARKGKKTKMGCQKPSRDSQSCAILSPSLLPQVTQYPRLVISTCSIRRWFDLLAEDYSWKLRHDHRKEYPSSAKVNTNPPKKPQEQTINCISVLKWGP